MFLVCNTSVGFSFCYCRLAAKSVKLQQRQKLWEDEDEAGCDGAVKVPLKSLQSGDLENLRSPCRHGSANVDFVS